MPINLQYTRLFFYKNKLNKNTQAEICPKEQVKNNHQAEILIRQI